MKPFCKSIILGLVCTVLLAGCGPAGPARFDASSGVAAGKSFQTMTSEMTEEQRQVFMARATALASLLNGGTKETPTADTMWKGIQGMTKAEIEAKANELMPPRTAKPAK
jgi:hypothetical protein